MRLSFLILIFFIVANFCHQQLQEQDPVFVTNIYGNPVHQKSLPVVFDFDQNVPKEKYDEFAKAVNDINEQLGVEAIKLSYFTSTDTKFDHSSKDGKNTIYWSREKNYLADAEQARTSIFWKGFEVFESDIRFNSFSHSDFSTIDLNSLIRHEFLHVLGLKHQHNNQDHLMNPYLKSGAIHPPLDKNSILAFQRVYADKLQPKKRMASK